MLVLVVLVEGGCCCAEIDGVLGRTVWDDDVAAGVDARKVVEIAGNVGFRCGGRDWGW